MICSCTILHLEKGGCFLSKRNEKSTSKIAYLFLSLPNWTIFVLFLIIGHVENYFVAGIDFYFDLYYPEATMSAIGFVFHKMLK